MITSSIKHSKLKESVSSTTGENQLSDKKKVSHFKSSITFEQSCLTENVKLSTRKETTHAICVYIVIWCDFIWCVYFLHVKSFQDGRSSRKSSQAISSSPSKFSYESLQNSLETDETSDDQRYS